MPLFDQATLHAAISDLLGAPSTSLPPDHTTAIIASVDEGKARFVIVRKLNEKWQIEGSVEHSWTGPPVQGGLLLKGSW